MRNADMPAMPIFDAGGYPRVARNSLKNNEPLTIGLTKREHFAGLAMQSYMIMCAGANSAHVLAGEAAEEAVLYADALLIALEKKL